MAKYYTSDLHFNHVNIIKPEYTRRGETWKTVPEMNEGLIQRYNEVVRPDDEVYIIGDFAMGDRNEVPGLVRRLMGHKHLILGNHDYKKHGVVHPKILEAGFESVFEEAWVQDGDYKLYLCHEPKAPPDGCQYSLVGHVHESFSRASFDPNYKDPTGLMGRFDPDPTGNIVNVGVDVSDYRPLTLNGLLARPFYVGKRHRI